MNTEMLNVEVEAAKVETTETKVKKPGFVVAWGETFEKFREVDQNRNLVIEEMKTRFPEKAENIDKWAEWYKGYFNSGKIKGYEHGKTLKFKWVGEPKKERKAKSKEVTFSVN